MLDWKNRRALAHLQQQIDQGKLKAIARSQAMIEFALDGTILNANENFLSTMGYSLADILGGHHSIFVPATYAARVCQFVLEAYPAWLK